MRQLWRVVLYPYFWVILLQSRWAIADTPFSPKESKGSKMHFGSHSPLSLSLNPLAEPLLAEPLLAEPLLAEEAVAVEPT